MAESKPSDVFNDLVKLEVNKLKPKPVIITDDPEIQIKVEEWLSDPKRKNS